MTTIKINHGCAFQCAYHITLRGEVIGDPVGISSLEEENRLIEQKLKRHLIEAVEEFYQCQLAGTSIQVCLL